MARNIKGKRRQVTLHHRGWHKAESGGVFMSVYKYCHSEANLLYYSEII